MTTDRSANPPVDWIARYPDLAGKTVIVTGDTARIVAITQAFATNGSLVAVVASDRADVDAAVAAAESAGAQVVGHTTDPASTAAWTRLAAHVEQRLGPIDVLVADGATALRQSAVDVLVPDMAARHRGAVVEVGGQRSALPPAALSPSAGVRHRTISGGGTGGSQATEVAAAALFCASDNLVAPWCTVAIGDQLPD